MAFVLGIPSSATNEPAPAAKPLPLPEVQISTLQEAFRRYEAGCPFRPGDIVSPREGFGYTGAGIPHVVIEVAAEPIRIFALSGNLRSCSGDFGERLDVRVARRDRDGDISAFWQESWRLEPYVESPAP